MLIVLFAAPAVLPALLTPFDVDDAVDVEALDAHVEFLIEAGVDGLMPCGTTGESPTVDFEEHHLLIDAAVKHAAKRIPIIAGTGANSTGCPVSASPALPGR